MTVYDSSAGARLPPHLTAPFAYQCGIQLLPNPLLAPLQAQVFFTDLQLQNHQNEHFFEIKEIYGRQATTKTHCFIFLKQSAITTWL
ncbi:hypothetical protein B6N25_10250 [Sphingobacteriales bacterium TSM_CSS]|nr:hypothetical protein B6N25_10250 [Sphingobacteriales bacterium TSM_CSS]